MVSSGSRPERHDLIGRRPFALLACLFVVMIGLRDPHRSEPFGPDLDTRKALAGRRLWIGLWTM
jgi:hypothetical protein